MDNRTLRSEVSRTVDNHLDNMFEQLDNIAFKHNIEEREVLEELKRQYPEIADYYQEWVIDNE